MATSINFSPQLPIPSSSTIPSPVQRIVGRKPLLTKHIETVLSDPESTQLLSLVDSVEGGESGSSFAALMPSMKFSSVHVLPEKISRHNTPARTHAITSLISSAPSPAKSVSSTITVVLEDSKYAVSSAMAIARAFPIYVNKKKDPEPKEVHVNFAAADGTVIEDPKIYNAATIAADAVRLASRIVDTPAAEMNVSHFTEEAKLVCAETDSNIEIIKGEELRDRGYGGLWNVGKAAIDPPALVSLTKHLNPSGKKVALVGKGIVYDTGGLSLKISGGMCGMKSDCGGAAAMLAAYKAICLNPPNDISTIQVILCLAENSIGPDAVRNDDIITFKSGRTCEINNTDAEGRLVLADGVAHATMVDLDNMPDLLVDMATLTGAQMVSTGRRHAAIVTNDEEVELAAVKAGKLSGDLCHPLIYAPELFNSEFASKVSDSKNSVKDRMNAQSSCAGQFVGNNVSEEFYDNGGAWMHVDMAGPSMSNERATGYGVGLALALLKTPGLV